MKASPFQYVIMGLFITFLVGGVLAFALFGGGGKGSPVGDVVIWGTADTAAMEASLASLVSLDQGFQGVHYFQKKPETYEAELVNAFASGQAPDLFLIDDTQIVSFKDKVQLIPYKRMSQRTFNDSFIDEAGLFSFADGIVGLPMYVNPLVMYWNKDLFAGASVASYPRLWSELTSIAPKMTALDTASNVKRSAVSLGTFDNVRYSKEIISALLLQLGNSIVGFDANGKYVSVLSASTGSGVESPAEAVVRFYTSFSNPSQSTYSWNRSLPNSFNAFTSGDVGMYFGFASDYPLIMTRNPNLAFGVALMPQTGSAKAPVTYGRLTALAMPRGAKNPSGALTIALLMTGTEGSQTIAQGVGLPSARRDVLTVDPSNAASSVFVQSALIARGWYDPGVAISGPIIKTMIESTISGKAQLGGAVQTASMQLTDVFSNINRE